MTQVKFFEERSCDDIENCVNQFLQENASSIKVIDIKYTTYIAPGWHSCKWTAMIIYEKLH